MPQIVSYRAPSDEFSTAESLQREHPWLSRVLASEADRYWMSMFPGFTLAKHEIQEENGLMVESVKIFVSRGIMQGPSGLRHHDANDC